MEGRQVSTAARLRKTFQYPTDDSSNDSPDVLDEDEQDNLIQTLRDQNETRNSQFRIALMALPALASIPYLLSLWRPSTFLLSVLSLTSLGSTAWLLHTQEPTETGFPALDAWATTRNTGGGCNSRQQDDNLASSSASSSAADVRHFAGSSSTRQAQQQRRRRLSSFSLPGARHSQAHRSPLEAHLPLLNALLCLTLGVMGLIVAVFGSGRSRLSDAGVGHHLSLALLPAVIYAVVVVAKVVMAGVDPESELAGLKYEYKGA